MHAIVTPILTLAHNYRHDGREMTFYTTHQIHTSRCKWVYMWVIYHFYFSQLTNSNPGKPFIHQTHDATLGGTFLGHDCRLSPTVDEGFDWYSIHHTPNVQHVHLGKHLGIEFHRHFLYKKRGEVIREEEKGAH